MASYAFTHEVLVDPYPLLAEMRERDPVYWSDELKGWILTRHDDVVHGFRDLRLSSDRAMNEQLLAQQTQGRDTAYVQNFLRLTSSQMLYKDGAEHKRLRSTANQAFRANLVKSYEVSFATVAAELNARLRGRDRAELVTEFAEEYVARGLCAVLGLPENDWQMVRAWFFDFMSFVGASSADREGAEATGRRADAAAVAIERYLHERTADLSGYREHHLIRLFLTAEASKGLSRAEVFGGLVNVFNASITTVVDMLSILLDLALTHDELRAAFRGGETLAEQAVAEVLRYDTSIVFINRVVHEELELRGRTLRVGDLVFLCCAAANRDPSVFPEPDRLILGRPNVSRHITFGSGPHACPGANVSARQLRVAMVALLDTFPEMRLEKADRRVSLSYRAFNALRVTLGAIP